MNRAEYKALASAARESKRSIRAGAFYVSRRGIERLDSAGCMIQTHAKLLNMAQAARQAGLYEAARKILDRAHLIPSKLWVV